MNKDSRKWSQELLGNRSKAISLVVTCVLDDGAIELLVAIPPAILRT